MTFEKERGRAPVKRDTLARKPRRGPLPAKSAFEGDRIAKIMARVGLCSRRDAEAWVRAGRVSVNGARIVDPALNITASDIVTVDGQPLAEREKTRLFLFNKPRGLVTSDHDPEGRPTVFAYIAHNHPDLPRVVSVGRLDINTEGLLLLTNDGGLARVLELPSTGWLRRYRVRAHGTTTPEAVLALKAGVTIEGIDYQPIDATLDRVQGANTWLTVALREGKNREVRKVLEHLGLEVNRLIRISYGPFQLGEAPDGAAEEVRTRVLMDQLGPSLIAEARADFSSLRIEERREQRRAESAADAPPPQRGRPVAGKHKHVSAMREERAEHAKGPRVRTERGATEDRRGRKVAVERKSAAIPKPEETQTRNGRRFRDERAPPRDTGARGRPEGGRENGRTSRDERKPPRFNRDERGPSRNSRDERPARSGPREDRPPRFDTASGFGKTRPPGRNAPGRNAPGRDAPGRTSSSGRPPSRTGPKPEGRFGGGPRPGGKPGGSRPSGKPGGPRPGGKPGGHRPGGPRGGTR